METALRIPILLICLSLLLQDVFIQGFVVDRRGREADELTEALKIIQRAKRRLVDDDFSLDKEDYWMNRLGLGADDDALEEGDSRALRELFEEGPEEGVLEDEEEHEEEVGRNELESLFGGQEEEEIGEKEVEDILEEEKNEVKGSKTPMAKEEIQQVFETSEPNEDGTNTVKIHEDNWLITPDKTLHNSNEDEKQVPSDDLQLSNQEQMEQMGENQPIEVNTKRKRSEDQVLAEEVAREQAAGEDGDFDLSYIKKFIELEDEENTNLANALNLATRSQVERTDKYIPLEVQYLKESIKDEETIQAIKDQLGIGGDDEEEEEEEEEAEAEDEDEDVVLEDEVFLPNPSVLEDDVPVIEDDDEEEENEIHKILSQHLKEFMLRTEMNRNDDTSEMDNDAGEWLNAPVSPSEGNDEEELNPFLRELLSKLYGRPGVTKRGMWRQRRGDMFDKAAQEEKEEEEEEEVVRGELSSLIEALEERNEIEDAARAVEEGVCPSVEEHTDDCAYVRGLGMGLDEEATNLCNRHQLCYICGAYYRMDADDCDKGFLSESDRLCEGDETCKNEAAGLYFFMLRDHVFRTSEATGFSCAAKCTYDFITGESEV